MLRSQSAQPEGLVVIVVSEEAKDYRPEMRWMARELTARGLETHCIEPRQVRFTEEGLRLVEVGDRPIGLIYRFYELFDLPNIPKSELIQYAAKKGLVSVTPPYKPALEEKSALSRRMAQSHHPRHVASGARFRDMADDAEAAGATIRRLIAQLGSMAPAADADEAARGVR